MQKLVGTGIFLVFIAPIFFLVLLSFRLDSFYHVPFGLFFEYLVNTFALGFGVGFLSFVFGVGSACSIAFLRFPGRRFVRYLLFLPLAVPPYVSALGYSYVLEFSGPICTLLRENFGIYFSFNIRSIWGTIFVMSISFYPYVYIITLSRLASAGNFVAVSRMCGKSFLQTVFKVLIPLARPSIIAGLVLVLMEVVSDFGVVQFFGVQTFATGIYRAWFLLHDSIWASRLVSILMLIIASLIFVEKKSRRNTSYEEFSSGNTVSSWDVSGKRAIGIFATLFLLPFFGLIFPVASLIFLSVGSSFDLSIFGLIVNSVSISVVTSVLTIAVASTLIYLNYEKKISTSIFQLSTFGYAIPGLVVGIGIINFLSYGIQAVDFIHQIIFAKATDLLLIGTFTSLVYSYVFRFLALGTSNLQSGIERIPCLIGWSLKLMGKGGFFNTASFYLPMMIRYVASGFVLIFIDTIKELSATLAVRPFNFDTMSTKVYDLVMDERYADAALPALISTCVCLCSIVLLMRLLYSKNLHSSRGQVKINCLCDVCMGKKDGSYC